MPAQEFKHEPVAQYVGEFIGTYFLVLTVGCNVLTGSLGAALSIGAMLMAMVYAIGPVSGAHLNPAVTISGIVAKKFTPDKAAYIVPQLLGGITAGVTYAMLFGSTFSMAPVGRWHAGIAFFYEIIFTAALCYVVLNVATTASQAGNHHFGLAIGFTVTSAAMTIGGISGCALNPAVGFGAMLVDSLDRGFFFAMRYFWLYTFGPILGGCLGAALFMGANPNEGKEF